MRSPRHGQVDGTFCNFVDPTSGLIYFSDQETNTTSTQPKHDVFFIKENNVDAIVSTIRDNDIYHI